MRCLGSFWRPATPSISQLKILRSWFRRGQPAYSSSRLAGGRRSSGQASGRISSSAVSPTPVSGACSRTIRLGRSLLHMTEGSRGENRDCFWSHSLRGTGFTAVRGSRLRRWRQLRRRPPAFWRPVRPSRRHADARARTGPRSFAGSTPYAHSSHSVPKGAFSRVERNELQIPRHSWALSGFRKGFAAPLAPIGTHSSSSDSARVLPCVHVVGLQSRGRLLACSRFP